MAWTQKLDNLPDEILKYENFIPVLNNKHPKDNNWDSPENWRSYKKIRYKAGFVLKGTGILVLDFDHVLNTDGTPDKRCEKSLPEILGRIYEILQGEITYTEYSLSGTGLHMVLMVDDLDHCDLIFGGSIIPLHDGGRAEYDREKSEGKHPPKCEVFYNCVHQFIFTGHLAEGAEPKQGAVNGSAAAAVMDYLIERLGGQAPRKSGSGAGAKEAPQLKQGERERLLSALNAIDANIEYNDWIRIGMACKNAGLTLEDWDAWSRKGNKYGEKGPLYLPENKWKTFDFDTSGCNAGTVIWMAKKCGWVDRWRRKSAAEDFEETYMPEDFTDIGQARALAEAFGDVLRYSAATKWLVYNGKQWEESEEKARKIIHKFTDLQLKEARKMLKKARKEQDAAAEAGDEDAMKAAKAEEKDAKAYRSHVLSYRKMARISATLTELAPYVLVDVKELDRDGYLLNTPEGTVNLKTGEIRPHDPADYCTKITACGPSKQGAEEWARFLEQITGGDRELENYLQICFGMAAVGVVKEEKLLIPFGSGGNGKSTTCFAVYHVLGDYSGSIKPEALIIRKTSGQFEFADLRGKRLALAAELQEGQRLNTSAVKKICSIDVIKAEKKFKDEFEFIPSHTVMLFTNHLPKIGSNDSGTLDRLVVLPFKGRFRDTEGEIKNYAEVLADRCGGAILTWVIKGAKKFIEGRCRLPECEAVKEATAEYTRSADWLGPFLEDMCETDLHYSQRAGKLYERYRAYCSEIGESYIRSAADFRAEMEKKGYLWRKSTSGAMYHGVRLCLDFDEAEETETVGAD